MHRLRGLVRRIVEGAMEGEMNAYDASSHETESNVKDKILNATDWSDWVDAVRMQYGERVPLFHATTEKNAEIIDREGFRLVYGKNRLLWGDAAFLYFQLGKSDYVGGERPVLYRLDVPIGFLSNCEVDMDGVNVGMEELSKSVDMQEWDDLPSDVRDAIEYFIWNDFKLEGTELVFYDYENSGNILKGLNPVKIKTVK